MGIEAASELALYRRESGTTRGPTEATYRALPVVIASCWLRNMERIGAREGHGSNGTRALGVDAAAAATRNFWGE
jgi:hypothetical protein